MAAVDGSFIQREEREDALRGSRDVDDPAAPDQLERAREAQPDVRPFLGGQE